MHYYRLHRTCTTCTTKIIKYTIILNIKTGASKSEKLIIKDCQGEGGGFKKKWENVENIKTECYGNIT